MSIELNTLLSFTPRRLQERLAANPLRPLTPAVETFPAVVFWADISGFTRLTEKIVAGEERGVETLSDLLNDYFARLIDLIHDYQGDIVKFAGDGLLAIWSGDIDFAAAAAAHCALDIQARLRDFRTPTGDTLLLRIGLAVGEVSAFHLGGILNRWEFVLLGGALAEATAAERDAAPGQVVVTASTWARLAAAAVGEMLPSGRVLLKKAPPLPPAAPFTLAMTAAAQQALPAALHAYLPGAAVARLAAGQRRWLAELRRVSAIFVRLPALNYDDINLERSQELMHDVQGALYRYEGSLNKISMDDKGVVILAAFGLPPLSHEDDPVRAVLAAVEIHQVLARQSVPSLVGVATGQAFCGMIGNQRRREYTMIGDVVNLAARLMQAADRTHPILVEGQTVRAAEQQIAFDALAALALKGKRELVPVFQPLAEKRAGVAARPEMVGRQAEQAAIWARIGELPAGKGGIVIVEGEAGIGKSRLVDSVARQAAAADIRLLVGSGNAIEKFTTYYVWRAVLLQLFGLEQPAGSLESSLAAARQQMTAADRQHIQQQLADWVPELATLAPLLNDILPLDVADNELTSQMQGQGRAINTQKLLLGLLRQFSQAAPVLLILEDAHWLDSSSWSLVRQIQRQLPSLLLLVVTRPIVEPVPADYAYLAQVPGVTFIALDVLPAADVERLVRQRLGVSTLDPAIAEFIRIKAEGHPFFSEELAYALRDGGLLEIVDDHCRLAAGVNALEKLSFPDTLQGVITSRIDLLPPPEQLALKVASVIGRVFAFQVLCEVYPIQDDKDQLNDYLDTLAQLDLTPLDTPEPDLAYIFKHIVTQEVAYNLMLFAQRQQLHKAVAEWYEQIFAADLAPYYSLLAHHWTQAAVWEKAVYYLVQAGEQALQRYATQEAARLLSDAIEYEREHLAGGEFAATDSQRACWKRLLGMAHVLLGNLPQAREQLESALALLGSPIPATERAQGLAILAEAGRQALHLLWPARFVVGPGGRPAPDDDGQRLLVDKYMAYEALSEVYFFGNDRLGTLYCVIRRLNVLERAAPIAERARAYSGACIASGLVPLRRLARHYERQARAADEHMPLASWGRMQLDLNLYRLGAAAPWAQTLADLSRARAMYEQLGDHHRLGEVLTLLSLAYYYSGRLDRSQELMEELARLAVSESNEQQEIWSYTGRARNFLPLGRFAETVTGLQQAQILLARNADHASALIAQGTLARAYWQLGEAEKAIAAAEKTMAIIRGGALTAFPVHIGFDGAAGVFLCAWAAAPAERARFEPLAKEACAAFDKFARVFPLGRAEARRSAGWLAWLAGKETRAQKLWAASLDAARTYDLPYEAGRTLLLMARHAAGPEQQRLAREARAHLQQVGAVWELEQADSLIN